MISNFIEIILITLLCLFCEAENGMFVLYILYEPQWQHKVHVLWNQPNLPILVIKSEGTNGSASRIPRGSNWAPWWPRICEERRSSKKCKEGWDNNQTAASENQFTHSEPYRGAFMSPNPLLTGITYPSLNPNFNHKQSYPSNKTLVLCGPSQLPPPFTSKVYTPVLTE